MSVVLSAIIKPTLVLFGAAALARLQRRSSASVRHAIWIMALLSAALLPLAIVLVPQLEWSSVPEGRTSVTFFHVEKLEASHAVPEPAMNGAKTYTAEPTGVRPPTVGAVYDRAAFFVWMLGVAVLLLRLGKGTMSVRRLANDAASAADGAWFTTIKELSIALGIGKPVRLLLSENQVSPMTWGLMRYTILLPSAARTWSDERIGVVLAHELAHVKRNDGLAQIFTQIVCSIYWFNPLVWYAAKRLRIESERACDDYVLRMGMAPSDYAEHLVQIVRGLRRQRAYSIAAVSMAQASQLETRLVSILDSRVQRQTVSKIGSILICVFTGLLTTSMAMIGVAAAVPMPPVFIAKATATPQRTRIGNAPTVPNNAVFPPLVLESKPPIYTDEAIRENIEGTVTLEASVDVDGRIKILGIVKGLGYGLDQRAIGAVLDWRFAPATRNGVRVEAVTQIDVDFKIPVRLDPKDGSKIIAFSRGAGVSPPTIISRVEPQYTAEALAARYQGSVALSAIVHRDGTVSVERIRSDLGFGLTRSAVEAIEQWRFKPATSNGEPVAVSLNVQVDFTLNSNYQAYPRTMGDLNVTVAGSK